MARYGLGNESARYREIREALLQAEIALKDQREKGAELRRELPADTGVEDYVFVLGPRGIEASDETSAVTLSELFDDTNKPLILVHFMYGKGQEGFCPMCTMWADGYDGVVPHLEQHVNFAVIVAGDVTEMRRYARSRGWRNIRLLSAGESTIKQDLGFEGEDGSQLPGVSVFTLDGDGQLRHYYSGGAIMGEGQFRGMDLLSPVWNFLDLTPEGRGEWFPSLSYE